MMLKNMCVTHLYEQFSVDFKIQFKAMPQKRLNVFHIMALKILHYLAQKLVEIHQYSRIVFMQFDT